MAAGVRGHNARASAAPSFLLLLAMLAAFLAQSIATQSHIHFRGLLPSSSISADAGHASIATQDPTNIVADCPLCDELAMAGHYLAPPPVTLLGAPPSLFWLFATPVAFLLCRQRSHRWQSRAPPR